MKDTGTDLMTYSEAMAYCRLKSEYLLRKAVRRRELQAIRHGARTVRFAKSELDRWMESKRTSLIKRR
jgi:excisionase family DNA binding protein